jgi:hypothetical protein
MPKVERDPERCRAPEELGGACYFEPVSDELSDWMPTHEHFPRSKREGGHRDVDNAILAHRLCNRIDYSDAARSDDGHRLGGPSAETGCAPLRPTRAVRPWVR